MDAFSCQQQLNVVVTGGSTGIGSAIVSNFAKAGHRVLLTYLTGLLRAQQLKEQYPKNISVAFLDQGDIQSVMKFASEVNQWCGSRGVDVLVNNAALGSATVNNYVKYKMSAMMPKHYKNHLSSEKIRYTYSDTESDTTMEEIVSSDSDDSTQFSATNFMSENGYFMLKNAKRDEALLKVNSLGPLWLCDALQNEIHKAAYRRRESNATIIFIGSVGGGSSAVFPEYCAADAMSKAATTYLSKHLAAKYVREPIDVMCISPGATETEMFRESTLSKVSDEKQFIDGMPKRKLINPDDMGKTVLWLSTQCPKGLFHGANLDASMGLAIRPGLQTETYHSR